jgi:hypothetical protein
LRRESATSALPNVSPESGSNGGKQGRVVPFLRLLAVVARRVLRFTAHTAQAHATLPARRPLRNSRRFSIRLSCPKEHKLAVDPECRRARQLGWSSRRRTGEFGNRIEHLCTRHEGFEVDFSFAKPRKILRDAGLAKSSLFHRNCGTYSFPKTSYVRSR